RSAPPPVGERVAQTELDDPTVRPAPRLSVPSVPRTRRSAGFGLFAGFGGLGTPGAGTWSIVTYKRRSVPAFGASGDGRETESRQHRRPRAGINRHNAHVLGRGSRRGCEPKRTGGSSATFCLNVCPQGGADLSATRRKDRRAGRAKPTCRSSGR